jgi:DNA-binding beta-propeller fold protein YncE
VALTAACLSFPAHALAAVESGALSPSTPFDCVGEPTSAEEKAKSEEREGVNCSTQVPYGLDFAYQVAISPDGKNAYSVAVNGDLIEYSRNQANGSLTQIGCFSSLPKSTEPNCAGEGGAHAEMEVAAVAEPAAVAISADGTSVYVISQGNNTIAEFSREAGSGLLAKTGCITHEASLSECEATEAKGLDLPYGLAVSADGENVYVASFGEEAVGEFKRNTETGKLTQLSSPNECIGKGCGTAAIGLKEDIGVVVSPDGRNVYVAAGAKGTEGDIAEFARGAEGALEQLPGEEGCISELVAGCKVAAHVEGSEDLLVSPDGNNVYANSYPGGASAVIELKRTESGELEELASPNECISSETLAGCAKAERVGGPLGLAISPDGDEVYATSANENSVAAFARGAEGALEQLPGNPCVTDEASGCGGAPFDSLFGLRFARRLTVSPDGTNVYVAGQEAHAIVVLARTVKPIVSRIDLSYGSPEGGTEVHIKGSGFAEGAKVLFGGVQATSVTVNSATSITVFSPAGAEATVAVRVENEAGISAAVPADLFTYSDKPVVTGVSASVGSETGGNTVIITGSEFDGLEAVHFGSQLASNVTLEGDGSIKATTPPGKGTVDITVTTPNGTSKVGAADKYSYVDGKPVPLSGLFLVGYCNELGDETVTLEKDEVGGTGFAYENWACLESNGAELPIANSGPAPSMTDACRAANPGVTSYAYAEDPNNAYSWGCYEVEPPAPAKEKDQEKGGGTTTTATIAIANPPPGTGVPAPALAKSGNVAPLSGTVLVKLPGSSTFVSLSSLRQIPFGTVIEATHGHVSVTTALPHGGTQTGEFFEGEFILTQGPNGMVVATLTGGDFAVCPTKRERLHIARASAAHASGKHVVRKLWANAHGSFSTKGNYAAGAVQGTEWLTEDLCEGTLIKVTRDKVAVTNLVTHRHVEVKVGHHYLAKAP